MLYYLKPLPFKKDFLNSKAVSVTMIAQNEKMTPIISYPFFVNLTLFVQNG